MTIVIADDITGAAEMAGIALRYNLSAIVADDVSDAKNTDVLIVYTNTRSMSKREAARIMYDLTEKARLQNPDLFYKKTDSVLRGHVLAEMDAQLKALGLKKALLVPVNPALGRVISQGVYYVNDQPVHETSFSYDPEFPITSSRVEEMLAEENIPAQVIPKKKSNNWEGIAVGEASTVEDLKEWANTNDGSMLLAGGGSFFNALLATKQMESGRSDRRTRLSSPLLFVSGTTFQKNVERIKGYSSIVSYMPDNIFSASGNAAVDLSKWADEVIEKLNKNKKAIVAIDNSQNKKGDADLLRERIAEVTRLVFEKINISELLIEGGSVAYTIVQKLGWKSFIPTQELEQGIVRMHVLGQSNIHLTIKPGSYEWPEEWNFS